MKFKINNNGFEFAQFSSLYGLNIVGNVSQKRSHNYIQFEQMKNAKEGGISSLICLIQFYTLGCMWYNLKQSVENGFKMSFSLRFKRAMVSQVQEMARRPPNFANLSLKGLSINDTMSPYKMALESPNASLTKDSGPSQTAICIVIQNEKDITSYKKSAPSNLEDLNEYIAIKINLVDTSNKTVISLMKLINALRIDDELL